jgi:RNA polymerase sigma-70 factor (ECF subfamily)
MNSDRELAMRVAVSGDQAAFGQLVERHQTPVRRFLRRLVASDVSAADDLAQDTFIIAYQKMHTWKGTAQLTTWLHTIAYRLFLDHVRKHSRTSVMAEVPQDGTVASLPAEAEILARQLMSLLSPEDRTCMTLAYSAGMSHAEISEIVDLPLGSVKSRIHRGKLKLQQWLKEHDHPIQTNGSTPPKEDRHAGSAA